MSGAELKALMSRAAMNCLREKIGIIEKNQSVSFNNSKNNESMIITRKHIKISLNENLI